jgi:hypothetical protein
METLQEHTDSLALAVRERRAGKNLMKLIDSGFTLGTQDCIALPRKAKDGQRQTWQPMPGVFVSK